MYNKVNFLKLNTYNQHQDKTNRILPALLNPPATNSPFQLLLTLTNVNTILACMSLLNK